MFKHIFLLFFLLSLAHIGRAEKIDYEIYKLDKTGATTLIAKGTKEYSDADITIQERNFGEKSFWLKSLELENGFSIGASIYPETEITGFGLWARRSSCGFSWEWFSALASGRFEKLQETGLLSVAYRQLASMKEISKITFDTDVALRLKETQGTHQDRHRILIKQGSVLKFPSNNSLPKTVADNVPSACAPRTSQD